MNALIIFDGVCGFCNASVQFIIRRDPTAHFLFTSLQSPVGREALTRIGHDSIDSIIMVESGTVYIKSEAVLQICRRLTKPWCWLWWFRWISLAYRDSLYDWFAAHRYQFRGTSTCQLPTPEQRKRIL